MIVLSLVALAANVWILATYALLARTGRERPFHWANAIGCLPLLAVELVTGAWSIVPLSLTFGVLGLVGVMKKEKP